MEAQQVRTLVDMAATAVARSMAPREALTEDVREIVRRIEFQRTISAANDPCLFNEFFGWMSGLNSVLQNKAYRAVNALSYERSFQVGRFYQFFPKVRYMMWYLRQEPDFLDRYPQKGYVKYHDYHVCDGSCVYSHVPAVYSE